MHTRINFRESVLLPPSPRAKQFVVAALRSAKVIELRNLRRWKYFRIVADVILDGQSLAPMLVAEGRIKGTPYPWNYIWCPQILWSPVLLHGNRRMAKSVHLGNPRLNLNLRVPERKEGGQRRKMFFAAFTMTSQLLMSGKRNSPRPIDPYWGSWSARSSLVTLSFTYPNSSVKVSRPSAFPLVVSAFP